MAASMTRFDARHTSGPIPSPSMKGIIGLLGTINFPPLMEIFSPSEGLLFVVLKIISLINRRIIGYLSLATVIILLVYGYKNPLNN